MGKIEKSLSGIEIIQELGQRYAHLRKRAKLTQKDIAKQSGISVFTISGFENGTQTGISMASFIKLMRALDEMDSLDTLLPEAYESPSETYFRLSKKTKKK